MKKIKVHKEDSLSAFRILMEINRGFFECLKDDVYVVGDLAAKELRKKKIRYKEIKEQ